MTLAKPTRIPIQKLLLDIENPRYLNLSSQLEIINHLIKEEKVVNLAKDIASSKSLNPLEIVGVIPSNEEDDEYIVIEGNRRVCALLLLNNPELCQDENIRKILKKLSSQGDYPDSIECRIFSSREEADHWIELRHAGEQDGIGIKRWDATQIARFQARRGKENQNIQATFLLDYAVRQGIIREAERQDFSVTTLQRYLNNPLVRNIFGLQDRKKLLSKHTPETFKKLVSRFLEDAKSGKVHSRSKKQDWQAYANLLQREVTDPPHESNQTIDYAITQDIESNKENGKNRNPDKKRSHNLVDPTKRKYLIPYDVKFSIKDKILRRLYNELRRIEIEGHEFSVAFLLRAFIEKLTILYLQKYLPAMLQKETKLHIKLQNVRDDLKKKGINEKTLSPLSIATSDKNSLLSPLMLGSMVHSNIIPTKRELINIWDRMQNILVMINEYL